jgi:hypothetical protein
VRLEGFGKLKKSTSSGLEPATFQLAAQCLNQLCYCMPISKKLEDKILKQEKNFYYIHIYHLVIN